MEADGSEEERRGGLGVVGRVTLADTPFARSACEKVEKLLLDLRATGIDRTRSTSTFDADSVRLALHHVSGRDELRVDLHFTADGLGSMFSPLGHEEYYQLRGDRPVEGDALDDLAVVLTSTYAIEETWWRGRRVRPVVRQRSEGDEVGVSVSGWPLLPPQWLLARDRLIVRRGSWSSSDHPEG